MAPDPAPPLLSARRPQLLTKAAISKFQLSEARMDGRWAVDSDFSYAFGKFGHAAQSSRREAATVGKPLHDILDAVLAKKRMQAELASQSGEVAQATTSLRILDVGAGKGQWLVAAAKQVRKASKHLVRFSTAYHGLTGGAAVWYTDRAGRELRPSITDPDSIVYDQGVLSHAQAIESAKDRLVKRRMAYNAGRLLEFDEANEAHREGTNMPCNVDLAKRQLILTLLKPDSPEAARTKARAPILKNTLKTDDDFADPDDFAELAVVVDKKCRKLLL